MVSTTLQVYTVESHYWDHSRDHKNVVAIVKLHQFAGQVRVWSARLKGEHLVNFVVFKKAVFKDVGGFLKSRSKSAFLYAAI